MLSDSMQREMFALLTKMLRATMQGDIVKTSEIANAETLFNLELFGYVKVGDSLCYATTEGFHAFRFYVANKQFAHYNIEVEHAS